MRHQMNRLDEFLSRQKPGTLFVLVILLVASFGHFDYQTGFEISFSFFYLIPIGLAAWYLNLRAGLFVTVLSIATWLTSNWLAGEVHTNESIRYFNAVVRMLVFGGVAVLLYEVRFLLDQERVLSRTDHLTGISNRREFYARAEMEIRRAKRFGFPLSVAYLDVDNFKQVNDERGHSEGDRLLKLIASTTVNIIRKTDTVARMGGDEFVLLFPHTNREGTVSAMMKVREAVERSIHDLPVTLSIGVVTFLRAPASVDSLLHQADELMYQAKEQGKGRIFSTQVD